MRESINLHQYLEKVTGESVLVSPLPEGEKAKLPIFLEALYDLQVAELFGRRWVLAVQGDSAEVPLVPSELVRHLEQLRNILHTPVVLVPRGLTAYVRQQLIRRAVPFAAPGSQIFLPLVWIDLRERFPRSRPPHGEELSAPAQMVMLHLLLKEGAEVDSLRGLALKLGYSAMTLSKVADELTGLKLCAQNVKNRSRVLRLSATRRQLWRKARRHMRSPVRARHWVRRNQLPEGAPAAGMTALERLSMIAGDPLPVFALRERDYRKFVEEGRIQECPSRDGASAQVECWNYDPALLGDGGNVDPLSLILSLADSPDERVRKALREVEEKVW